MRRLMISARREPFEIGARLFAILAFPGTNEAVERRRAANAWCAGVINCTKQQEPGLSAELDARYPRYVAIDQRSINQALRKTKSRIRNRQVAGRMVRGHFQEWIDQRPAVLPASIARLSINELAKLVGLEGGQDDPENTEKRVWRTSRPVFHLASALDFVGRFYFLANDNAYDLNNGDMHRLIIELAEVSEQVVDGDARFGVLSDELLRIRLK